MGARRPRPARPILVVLDQSNFYQSRVVAGIRERATALAVPLLLVARDPFARGLAPSLQRALDRLDPLGVITNTLDTAESDDHLSRALADRPALAAVHVGSHRPGCGVYADNAAGMAALVHHVITACGVRRPVVVRGIAHQPDSVERETVLRAVFVEHGIELDESLFVDGHFHRDNAYRSVSELLATRRDMDAVLAFNDRSALGAMDAVTEAGLRIPQDVVVTGFDDDPLSPLSVPALTSVGQDVEQQGAVAVDLLLRIVAGESADEIGDVRVPTRLVVRATTDRSGATASLAPSSTDVQQLWEEVQSLDAILAVARAFTACGSVEELSRELVAALPSLTISRCFLVLTDPPATPDAAVLARVVLAHPAEPGAATEAEPLFEAADILPAHLAHHLHTGTLTVQPLSTEAGEIGYLLFEQGAADRFVSDALRMDLSRSLESLRRTAELADRTRTLTALVAQRTRELELEAQTRRRAEAELQTLNDELRVRLHLDGLTGICNRVGFDERLFSEWTSHSHSGAALSLLMVDVDHFKLYNDGYGHLAGDECLRAIAQCLSSSVRRPNDLAARYGGEEFAVVLPNTDASGALLLAGSVQAELARARLSHRGSPTGWVTVSIGIAAARPDATNDSSALVAAADRALYAAKAAGRNRIVSAPDGPPPTEHPAD